eukprot:4244311-Amphidinium_carterae.1
MGARADGCHAQRAHVLTMLACVGKDFSIFTSRRRFFSTLSVPPDSRKCLQDTQQLNLLESRLRGKVRESLSVWIESTI